MILFKENTGSGHAERLIWVDCWGFQRSFTMMSSVQMSLNLQSMTTVNIVNNTLDFFYPFFMLHIIICFI